MRKFLIVLSLFIVVCFVARLGHYSPDISTSKQTVTNTEMFVKNSPAIPGDVVVTPETSAQHVALMEVNHVRGSPCWIDYGSFPDSPKHTDRAVGCSVEVSTADRVIIY